MDANDIPKLRAQLEELQGMMYAMRSPMPEPRARAAFDARRDALQAQIDEVNKHLRILERPTGINAGSVVLFDHRFGSDAVRPAARVAATHVHDEWPEEFLPPDAA